MGCLTRLSLLLSGRWKLGSALYYVVFMRESRIALRKFNEEDYALSMGYCFRNEVNSIFILVQKHCLRLAMLASAVFALSRCVQLKFNNVATRCVLGVP